MKTISKNILKIIGVVSYFFIFLFSVLLFQSGQEHCGRSEWL